MFPMFVCIPLSLISAFFFPCEAHHSKSIASKITIKLVYPCISTKVCYLSISTKFVLLVGARMGQEKVWGATLEKLYLGFRAKKKKGTPA